MKSPGFASRRHWCRNGAEEAQLGKLVQFDRRGRHPKARPESSGKGQVVLFTGVRYERDGTPLPAKPLRGARSKRKRG